MISYGMAYLLSGSLAGCLAVIAAAAPGAAIPAIVAVVNGRQIAGAILARRIAQSRSMDPARFDAMSAEEKRRATVRVVRALVLQEVEFQEAVREHIAIPEERIEALLARERARFANERDFEQSLAEGHITIPEWKEEMRRSLMIARLEEQAAPHFGGEDSRRAWLAMLLHNAQVWSWEP